MPSGLITLANPLNPQHDLVKGLLSWWIALPGWQGGPTYWNLQLKNHATIHNVGTNAVRSGNHHPGGWGSIHLSGGYMSASDATFPSGSAARSHSFWCYLTNNGSYVVPFGYGSTTDGEFWGNYVDPSGNLYLTVNGTNVSGSYPGFYNAWHHVGSTHVASGASSLYVDGVLVGSSTMTVNTVLNTCQIGTNTVNANYCSGNIDDVKVWARCLSAAEVKGDYELGLQSYPGLLNRQKSMVAIMPLPVFTGVPAAAIISHLKRSLKPIPRSLVARSRAAFIEPTRPVVTALAPGHYQRD